MVLEGLRQEDKPIAVGYFILDTLRSIYQTGVSAGSVVRLKCGLISPSELEQAVENNETHVFLPPIQGAEDLGALYKIMVGVSRGDRRT